MVQSIDRALAILEALAQKGSPMPLSLVSSETKLNISTAHRLLSSLIEHGWVEQESTSKHYRLGIKVFEIGNRALYSLDIRITAKPFLQKLAEVFNETANLAIMDKNEVVYIDQVEAENIMRMMAHPGTRAPSYCTAAGKAILAYKDKSFLSLFLKEVPLLSYTKNTITDPLKLEEELKTIQKLGFAVDEGEIEEDVHCLASPIFNHKGEAIASFSISGPRLRILSKIKDEKLLETLVASAHKVSELLGYKIPAPLR